MPCWFLANRLAFKDPPFLKFHDRTDINKDKQLFNHLSTYLGSQPCSTSCAVANDFWHANQKLKELFDSTADQTTGLDCYVTCRNISINQTHSNILNTKLINHRQADEVKMHEIKRATACHYWNKKKWKHWFSFLILTP